MYEIVFNFIVNQLFGVENTLAYILVDFSMILIYIAFVNMLVWVFRIASNVIKI